MNEKIVYISSIYLKKLLGFLDYRDILSIRDSLFNVFGKYLENSKIGLSYGAYVEMLENILAKTDLTLNNKLALRFNVFAFFDFLMPESSKLTEENPII